MHRPERCACCQLGYFSKMESIGNPLDIIAFYGDSNHHRTALFLITVSFSYRDIRCHCPPETCLPNCTNSHSYRHHKNGSRGGIRTRRMTLLLRKPALPIYYSAIKAHHGQPLAAHHTLTSSNAMLNAAPLKSFLP